jgi:GxxExxY protein
MAAGEEQVGKIILSSAMRVHSSLGCGLLESAYEACLAHEIRKQGLQIERQVTLPIRYDGVELDAGYRLDLLVDNCVVVELKAVEKIAPIHLAQLLSYLKLGRYKLGYILNFNVLHMRDGIKRVVNGL